MIKKLGFLLLLSMQSTWALVPLEGILYGDVKDISQIDPMESVHNKNAVLDIDMLNAETRRSFKEHIGLYREGANLVNSCQFNNKFKYSNSWKEKQAKRTIASALQYIGLDVTMKAIVEYVKLLEFEESEFQNLYKNLIVNTCSPNITVYSKKFLADNFKHLYKNYKKGQFETPSLMDSPFYSKEVKELTNSRSAKRNELKLSINNFRAFCSWNGDVDNYRLLTPYLNNSFVMSYVFNQLIGRKIVYNPIDTKIEYGDDPESIRVSCNNLICRKSNDVKFKELFPRVVGSTKLSDDLKTLYCGHFKDLSYKTRSQNPKILSWMKEGTIDTPYLESMNFLSLLTHKSDLLVASDKFTDLERLMKSNIKDRWNQWAKSKVDNLVTDILYEESLNVKLISQLKTPATLKGEFNLVFDFTMGEMDKVLNDVDKVTSVFHLKFPKNYLRWVRKEFIKRSNLSDYEGLKKLDKNIVEYVTTQIKQKEKYFLIPIWTDKISNIIAKELQDQLVEYRGTKLNEFTNKLVSVPVKFRFGLFALKYLNDKFKAKYRNLNIYQAKR